jgi:hypothetical protein
MKIFVRAILPHTISVEYIIYVCATVFCFCLAGFSFVFCTFFTIHPHPSPLIEFLIVMGMHWTRASLMTSKP